MNIDSEDFEAKKQMYTDRIGVNLKRRRRLVGLTQEELGADFDLRFSVISQYEVGSSMISATRMWQLCERMNVPAEYATRLPYSGKDPRDEFENLDPRLAFTPAEKRLARVFNAIGQNDREELLDVAEEGPQREIEHLKAVPFKDAAPLPEHDLEAQLARHLAQRLRERRLEIDMGQKDLAERIGLNFRTINKYEYTTAAISAPNLCMMSEVLGVTPGYFYSGFKGAKIEQLSLPLLSADQRGEKVLIGAFRGATALHKTSIIEAAEIIAAEYPSIPRAPV